MSTRKRGRGRPSQRKIRKHEEDEHDESTQEPEEPEESEQEETTKTAKTMAHPGAKGKKSKSSTTSSPKQQPKQKKKAKSRKLSKDEQKIVDEADPNRGFYESSGEDDKGNPIKYRRSKRLKDVREHLEEEESSSESVQPPPSTTNNKRKRGRPIKYKTDEATAPPKKKAKKLNKVNRSNICFPKFVDDDTYLTKIGIAYTKSKARSRAKNMKRKPKLYYKKQVIYKGKTYVYHNNERYELLDIKTHRLHYNPVETLKDDERDTHWHDTTNWRDVARYINNERGQSEDIDINHNHNQSVNDEEKVNNGHGDNVENEQEEKVKAKEGVDVIDSDGEIERPRTCFGYLLFECKWKDWPETTWERWEVIQHTDLFADYCRPRNWMPEKETHAMMEETNEEEFKEIIGNIAYFGDPVIRKALKVLVVNPMNVW